MAVFRRVTEDFVVSPQISVGDLATARAQGVSLVINNRPDGEAPDQPSSDEIAAAAAAEGLAYIHIPVFGRPTAEQASDTAAAAHAHKGVTLAFCRSGTRSIVAWAMGELASGRRPRAELLRLAANGGYDLASMLPG